MDDELATALHPKIEGQLAKAQKAAIGQKVVALEWQEAIRGGNPATEAFQAVLENGKL